MIIPEDRYNEVEELAFQAINNSSSSEEAWAKLTAGKSENEIEAIVLGMLANAYHSENAHRGSGMVDDLCRT